MGEWLAQIESLVAADVDAGLLPPFYRPRLQLLGHESQPALKNSTSRKVENKKKAKIKRTAQGMSQKGQA